MDFDKSRVEWLESDLLKDIGNVKHRTFLRHGGVSKSPYDTLNVGDGVGDHTDNVKVNREIVREMMEAKEIVFPTQVHGTNISEITSANVHHTHEADAFFTKEKNIAIGVCHADCQAAAFYDPDHKVIAVVHSGWKGLVKNIYAKLVATLKEKAGSDPSHLIVCISPSIGPLDAEFRNFRMEFPKEFWSFEKGDHHFDLWAIARMQLTNAGLKENHIEIMEISTFAEKNDYFSARRDKITGRHATVMMLT